MANGLYPHNSNMWQNETDMPASLSTYMKSLRELGYRTCSIGKNHLYPVRNRKLSDQYPKYAAIGFEYIEDMPGTWGSTQSDSIYTDHLRDQGLLRTLREYLLDLEAKPDQERRFIAEPLPIPEEAYMDAFIGRRVAKYVDEYVSDQPSFVFAGFQGPHEPWDAPERYCNMYPLNSIPDPIPELPPGDWLPDRSLTYHKWAQYYQPDRPEGLKEIAAGYFGKMTQIDDSIGEILQAYEDKGWLDNTVILFASDHGEMLGDLGRVSKSVCYDSAVRVPLIVRIPEGPTVGRIDAFVETIDIHGTLLDLAGGKIERDKDTLSVLPLIRGNKQTIRRDVLAEAHVHYMLRTEDRKIVIGKDGLTLQLFDLKSDPLEQKNLCGHPDYHLEELEMRSRLLTRITAGTYRPGMYDPEMSAHTYEDPE